MPPGRRLIRWHGVVLYRHTVAMMLLVPADSLGPRRPDEHFATEAGAAAGAGLKVALVDHDALTGPGGTQRAVSRVPGGVGEAVYRGWMLSSSQYAALAAALAARGVALRTSPAQYRRAHELPGWYPALVPVTPCTAWTAGDGREELGEAYARLGPGPAVLIRGLHPVTAPDRPAASARHRPSQNLASAGLGWHYR